MNMKELKETRAVIFCDDCNQQTDECFCPDVKVCEYQGKDFKWEYAHEGVSGIGSQFKNISPNYD